MIRLLGLSIIALFLAPSGFLMAGFGVSPGLIEETRLVPGSHFERTIYLVQGAPEKDVKIEVTVESEKASSWFSFKEGNTFSIPAGVQQFPLTVIVDVPEDTELGIYKAFIRVNTIPDQVEGAQVTIALGGRIDANLTVGDDVFRELSVRSIDLLDIKETEKPQATLIIENKGNVSAHPEAVTFELFNKFGEIRLGYGEAKEIADVKSFSEEKIKVSFPIDIRLAPGEYWGHVKVYDDGKMIGELRTVFNVTEVSFLERYQTLFIGITALLSLAVLFFIVRRMRRV